MAVSDLGNPCTSIVKSGSFFICEENGEVLDSEVVHDFGRLHSPPNPDVPDAVYYWYETYAEDILPNAWIGTIKYNEKSWTESIVYFERRKEVRVKSFLLQVRSKMSSSARFNLFLDMFNMLRKDKDKAIKDAKAEITFAFLVKYADFTVDEAFDTVYRFFDTTKTYDEIISTSKDKLEQFLASRGVNMKFKLRRVQFLRELAFSMLQKLGLLHHYNRVAKVIEPWWGFNEVRAVVAVLAKKELSLSYLDDRIREILAEINARTLNEHDTRFASNKVAVKYVSKLSSKGISDKRLTSMTVLEYLLSDFVEVINVDLPPSRIV